MEDNIFIQFIKEQEESGTMTQKEEQDLLDYIFDNSVHQTAEDFSKKNLNYFDALEIVQSDDSYPKDAIDFLSDLPNNNSLPSLLELTSEEKLAYYLAYENMDYGTKLLEELLYFREKGRI